MTHKQMILWALMAPAILCYAQGDGPADPDPNRFAKAIESFEAWDSQNAVPADPILFVGSSSIRGWKTRESFPDLPVINRGFGGSHISDVVHFSDRIVLPYAPKLIVFYAGDNDVAAGKSAARVRVCVQAYGPAGDGHQPLPLRWPSQKHGRCQRGHPGFIRVGLHS